MNFTPDCVSFEEVWLPWQMLALMITEVSFSSPWDEQMSSTINTPYLARSVFLLSKPDSKADICNKASLIIAHCTQTAQSGFPFSAFQYFSLFLSWICSGHRRHNLQSTQISGSSMWRWRETLKTSQNKNYRGIFFIFQNLFSSCFIFYYKKNPLWLPGPSFSFWWHNTSWIKESQKGKGRRKEITVKSHKVSVTVWNKKPRWVQFDDVFGSLVPIF